MQFDKVSFLSEMSFDPIDAARFLVLKFFRLAEAFSVFKVKRISRSLLCSFYANRARIILDKSVFLRARQIVLAAVTAFFLAGTQKESQHRICPLLGATVRTFIFGGYITHQFHQFHFFRRQYLEITGGSAKAEARD